jgi:hypothetical protein
MRLCHLGLREGGLLQLLSAGLLACLYLPDSLRLLKPRFDMPLPMHGDLLSMLR